MIWPDPLCLRSSFAAIKPSDAVIVGIYDRYSDQAAENAAYVRRFGSAHPPT